MKKRNIEKDLFKILKSKNSDELYYVILNMINNTYNYEFKYLNRVPYEEMMIYLEKIVVIGSRCKKFDTLEDLINAILRFSQHIDKLKFRHLRANKFLNIYYSGKLLYTKLSEKKMSVKVSGLILTSLILLSLYNHNVKMTNDNIQFDDINDDKHQELVLEDNFSNTMNDMLVYENNIETEVPYFEDNLVEKEISVEGKINFILEKYNLTYEEFNVVCAIAITESKPGSYDDTYAVINTIYNRTITKSWIDDINRYFGTNVGENLYYQAIRPNQFVVYETGLYLNNLNVREGEQFNAVIDFLYDREIKHEYLSFRSSNTNLDFSYEQFVSGGNKYFNRIREEDRIIQEEFNNAKAR